MTDTPQVLDEKALAAAREAVNLKSPIGTWLQDLCTNFVRAYLAALSSTPSDGGWIEWKGGDCPVDEDAIVEMRFRGGGTHQDIGSIFNWHHAPSDRRTNPSADIVAYRVVHP